MNRFLLLVKLYAFEVIRTIIVLLILVDFAIKEMNPLLSSIRNNLHLP